MKKDILARGNQLQREIDAALFLLACIDGAKDDKPVSICARGSYIDTLNEFELSVVRFRYARRLDELEAEFAAL